MTSRTQTAILRWTSLALAAILVTACSSQPQSQARASEGSEAPASASAASASAAPATAGSASGPPPSEASATAGSSATTATTVPPRPANVTWTQTGTEALAGGQTRVTHRLGWSEPDGAATSFTVYGVTDCLRNAKKYDGKPCVVKGMRIPKSALALIAEVPGSQRSVDIPWSEGEIGGGPYQAVLVRATNAAGDSIFAIAWSAAVCWQCTY